MTLIGAVSADGFISTGIGVPWSLPRDKEHFRKTTRGQWLLIGRRTYEEMLGWFRDHHPLVLTSDKTFTPLLGAAVSSVEEALSHAAKGSAREVFVCGGGGAYAAAMPLADRLIITHVNTILGGGVPFPVIPPDLWQAVSREAFPADAENKLDMTFAIYERRIPLKTGSDGHS